MSERFAGSELKRRERRAPLRLAAARWMAMVIFISLLASRVFAENIIFPTSPASPVINVKTAFGAAGDGVADDTAAIQNAITTYVGTHGRVLYFPNGTYRLTDRVSFGTNAGTAKGLTLQGQSQAGVVLRLADNAPGFSDAANPRAVVSTYDGAASDNQAFGNNLFNLTIDTGGGNGGAIGLSYLTSNYGSVRDVTIRSGDSNLVGQTGLIMGKAWPGPGMIRNLTVIGFNYGIALANAEYSMTFERVTLTGQKAAGIQNNGNIISLHQLVSSNTVPALTGASGSLNVILAAFCAGGASNRSAFEFTGGKCLLRNIATTGYQSAVKNNSTIISGTNQTEYVNDTPLDLFTSPQNLLGLEIQDTPEAAWDATNQWASVTSYGAVADDNGDDTAAIQSAIDNAAGKTTIYFPRGKYFVSGTIHIRNGIKRIYGAGSAIRFTAALYAASVPVFQFDSNAAPVVVFELFATDYPTATANFTLFKHNSTNAVVLRNLAINAGQAYTSAAGSGPLFVEDVAGNSWQINQQSAWLRQVNPELPRGYTKLVNDGGRLWILGLKTEKDDNVIETKNGGATEVLGGLLYPAGTVDAAKVAFVNSNSSLSVSIASSSYAAGNFYTTFVQETRGGSTLTLPTASVPSRSSGKICALYVGYSNAPALPAANSFRIAQITAASNTTTLAFTALADRSYTVQTNASLATNGWQKFTDLPASAERAVNVAAPMNGTRRFYRVVTPTTP